MYLSSTTIHGSTLSKLMGVASENVREMDEGGGEKKMFSFQCRLDVNAFITLKGPHSRTDE